jgi:hypothetical protein
LLKKIFEEISEHGIFHGITGEILEIHGDDA